MGLVSNIDEINKLLEKGVKTRKFVGYTSWTELINNLSQDTGNKIVQMSTGQVVEIVKYHDKATEGDTAGETNYGLVAVNVNETTFKTGEKVIDGVGEVITLTKDTAGIVISGTSDLSKVGNLGTYTPCEAGFLYVSKETFVTSVVAICGYAIEDDVAKQLVKDLDALPIDWGPDLLKADEIGTEEDKILCKIEKGGNTYFNKNGQDNVYNGLVQLDFFNEGGEIYTPDSFESGQTYTFNNLVSVKELANNQFNILKHVNFDALSGVTGFNERFVNLIDILINSFDESKLSGLGSVDLNIWLRRGVDYVALNISFDLIRTEMTEGRYEIVDNSNYPEHPYKKFVFNTSSFKNSKCGISNKATVNFLWNMYGWITYFNNDKNFGDETRLISENNYITDSDFIYGNYHDIPSYGAQTLYHYTYENWNVGTFSQVEEKYKKRKFPDAKTPDPSKSLEENYPDWDNKKDTTSKPNDSDPNKKDEYRPGKINNNKKDPNNTDNNSQKDSQDGKNTNKDIKDDTDSGKDIIDDINDPEQDPSDPDDDPIGETPDVLIPINPISDSGFVSLYNPSGFELRQLSQYLWSDNFINNIKKLFQDPMDAIIGLHMIFGSPTTGGKTNIKVGFVDTGVTANKITAQYFTIDCGTVNVREYFKDARDYDFCNISIYLPFVGIQKLNSKDLMDASVRVLATVDVVTGALLYEIDVTKKGLKQCLYTFSGNCAVQLPISAGSYSSAIANLIGIGAGIAGTVATGGALAPALISGIGSAAVNSHVDVQTSNSIGSNAGAMGIKKPYLIINRLSSYNANAYQKTQGYPSNKTAKIGSLKGVAKIKECHLEGIPATDEELEEIYTLLKQGVIL